MDNSYFILILLLFSLTVGNGKPRIDDSIIHETYREVEFYLRLPEPTIVDGKPEPTKPVGLIIDIENFRVLNRCVNHSLGIGEPQKEAHLKQGYALLTWLSPAQPLDIEKESNIDSAYGVNTSDLSPKMQRDRKKRWDSWLRKIDSGIEKLIKKYDLPENGYIASSWCIGTERLCRYIEYKPERFSAHITRWPIGLHASNNETKHIYTLLVDRVYPPKNPKFYNYQTHIKRFGFECNQSGAPYSVLYFKDHNTRIPEDKFTDYIIELRNQSELSGTLSNKEIHLLRDKIISDLNDGDYKYDYFNKALNYKEGYYSEFTASFPNALESKIRIKGKLEDKTPGI